MNDFVFCCPTRSLVVAPTGVQQSVISIRNISERVSGASLLFHGLIKQLASLTRGYTVSPTAYADVMDDVSLSLSFSCYYIPLLETKLQCQLLRLSLRQSSFVSIRLVIDVCVFLSFGRTYGVHLQVGIIWMAWMPQWLYEKVGENLANQNCGRVKWQGQ